MNIYEDEGLEEKLEELTDLLGVLLLDLMLVGLRKVVGEEQIFREFAQAKRPCVKTQDPF